MAGITFTFAAIAGLIAFSFGLLLFAWLVARFIEKHTAQQHPSDLADYARYGLGDCHCSNLFNHDTGVRD